MRPTLVRAIQFLGSIALLVGIGASVPLVMKVREARRLDEKTGQVLNSLVDSYSRRNLFLGKLWKESGLSGSSKLKSISPEAVLQITRGPARLETREQPAFLEFDRQEQLLFEQIDRYKSSLKDTKRGADFTDELLRLERGITESRKEYTQSAGNRNERWGQVPSWLRDRLRVKPFPHFRADLADWKNSQTTE